MQLTEATRTARRKIFAGLTPKKPYSRARPDLRKLAHMRSFLTLGVLFTCAIATADEKPIARITAAFGEASVQHRERSRAADLFSTIDNDDCVKTQDAGV